MTKESIGLLDSGVGGLSVLAQLKQEMPDYNYSFFGDTKNLPYGTKSKEEIFNYTKEILEFFLTKNIKNVAIACNTTSAVAYDDLCEYFKNKIKIYPLIQSVAYDITKNLSDGDSVAILATKATINSKKYEEEIKSINPNLITIPIDCTGFVEIVENRLYNTPLAQELIQSKINIAKKHKAKKIVLGCTHYPYLINMFKKIYDTQYFNPAVSIAKIIKNQIQAEKTDNPKINFYVSKNPEEFRLSAKMFFDIKENIEIVDFSEKIFLNKS